MQRNGIDVDQFQQWTEMVREHPAAAAAAATVRHRWDGGFAVDGRCESFEEAGETYARTHHTFRTDWPPPFGADSGPTPGAELLLAAVGACVATTYAAKAAVKGIPIEELEVITVGRVDLQGLLELNDVGAAFSAITVTIHVRSSADDAVLEELGRTVTRTSPVYDSLATPVPVTLAVHHRSATRQGAVT